MSIVKPNNNTISAITALPASITTGKVLQVVTATDSTERTTTSGSFVTGSNTLSVNITPSATSSKIFIVANTTAVGAAGTAGMYVTIYRGSTNLGASDGFNRIDDTAEGTVGMNTLDSPSTTSQVTYQVYFKSGSGTATLNKMNPEGTITAFEIAG